MNDVGSQNKKQNFFKATIMPKIQGLHIAGLNIRLNMQPSIINLILPPCHIPFNQEDTVELSNYSSSEDSLEIVLEDFLPNLINQRKLFFRCEFWSLWLLENGDLIFKTFNTSLPRTLVINQDFKSGKMAGDFVVNQSTGYYPLEDLDLILVINWLASFGDILLHASGIVLDGKGYAFIGHAGAGKSTLAAALATEHNALVLGEDNLILRRMNGEFWIYGTPWHQNPGMCSPKGVFLKKLFFLDKWGEDYCEPTSSMDGITRILQTAFIPYYQKKYMPKIMDNLSALGDQVPFYKLSYTLGTDPWNGIAA